MSDNLIKIGIEGEDVVIRCSISDLVFIAENDPNYIYKVIDKLKFAKEFCFELQNSNARSNQEGVNAVEELFQNAYESVAEQGDDEVMTSKDLFP